MKYANLLQKQFKKYFFISETCVSLLYQITTMKALPNNNKPATLFIEAYKTDNPFCENAGICHIHLFDMILSQTVLFGFKTIAIFKIRLK